MSQHSDILSHMIAKGIANGDKPLAIVHDIEGMLEVLEYDDGMVSRTYEHVYSHAAWMRTQKPGLYGITDSEFQVFLDTLWNNRQSLPANLTFKN
jgi:hypothetical protein